MFMEYCDEGTLESLATSTETGLPEELVRKYTRQLLEAVHTLHERGIVHRDIKGKAYNMYCFLKEILEPELKMILDFCSTFDMVNHKALLFNFNPSVFMSQVQIFVKF